MKAPSGVNGTNKESPVAKKFDLNHLFTYHAPSEAQLVNYTALRDAAKAFAQTIVDNTPPGADQSAAIRLVRQAVMTANAGVALKGRVHKHECFCGAPSCDLCHPPSGS